MKTQLIFLLLSLAGIISFSSCEKKNFDEMPPETRSGKNTFGCLIDGDLFVGGWGAPWMTAPLSTTYRSKSDHLSISVWGKRDNTFGGRITIGVNTPRQNSTQKFSIVSYFPDSDEFNPSSVAANDTTTIYCPLFVSINDGICTITKFDIHKKIVSGRFEFIGRCADWYYNIIDSTATTVQITQGRFDLKFDISND